MQRPTRAVAIIHPDLGIGGAERLVVDVALALQADPHNAVAIYTSHYDQSHCFKETLALDVHQLGDFLPRTIGGRFYIVCAFLRQLWLVLFLYFTGRLGQLDLIFVDQLSYTIPLIHMWKKPEAKVVFYCHYPDKLLASHQGALRKAYRGVWDAIEEWSTRRADLVLVNSNFTKSAVQRAFPSLGAEHDLLVVYPCVDTAPRAVDTASPLHNHFLSLNRFERKKGVDLAIRALSKMKHPAKLVVAGGYDVRVRENVEYLQELQTLCAELGLRHQLMSPKTETDPECSVYFWPNVDTDTKQALLKAAALLLYTPRNEHFGIVPLEAMNLNTLVLADTTGGPLETVVDYYENRKDYTGFNVDVQDVDKWAATMDLCLDPAIRDTHNGHRRAARFSLRAMQDRLAEILHDTLKL